MTSQIARDSDVPERRVRLDNVFNLRDLGGYPTSDGRVTSWGRLFRADGMNRLAGGDIDVVRNLGLRTVVDLRTDAEQSEYGVAPTDAIGATLVHLPLLSELWSHDDIEDIDNPVPFLVERYLEMTADSGPVLAEIIELVATGERSAPLVFHCSAGKDRTGVTAAVLLGLVGVDDATIAADYTATSVAMADLLAWVRANSPEHVDSMADQPPAFLACPPEAMLGFLARLHSEHGTVEGYVRSIGVAEDTIAAVRDQLLT